MPPRALTVEHYMGNDRGGPGSFPNPIDPIAAGDMHPSAQHSWDAYVAYHIIASVALECPIRYTVAASRQPKIRSALNFVRIAVWCRV